MTVLAALGASQGMSGSLRACAMEVSGDQPFCQRLPSQPGAPDAALFLGTVESVYPSREQERELMQAYFRGKTGGRRWPPQEPEDRVTYRGAVITATEAAAIRFGAGGDNEAALFRRNARLVRFRVDENFSGPAGAIFEMFFGNRLRSHFRGGHSISGERQPSNRHPLGLFTGRFQGGGSPLETRSSSRLERWAPSCPRRASHT